MAFVAHGNVADARRARADGVVQRQSLPAGQPEHNRYAVTDQHFDERIAAVAGHGAGLFSTSERTAARISGYAPQRQRFPARYSRISLSVACGFSFSRATVAIIKPGVQNEHWKA
jgi:hypothetical protein